MNQSVKQSTDHDFSDFLSEAGWEGAQISSMGADMGLRRYARLEKDGKQALFMDMSRSGILETGLKEYVEVAGYLDGLGVNVPDIYHHNLDKGFAVIESFGAESFGDALKKGEPANIIYGYATDILIQIDKANDKNTLNLGGYEDTLIRKRLSQFVDYYMPIGAGRQTTQADQNEFQDVIAQIGEKLGTCPMGFCHADYHLENLMWSPDKEGGYGLIDFQDAFWGFQGYDLLNLLENVRATVPDDIKKKMKARYCEGMSKEDQQVFDEWYVVMSAHWHCRVLGLFIKFARENGGVEFLEHIPRIQGYMLKNLENPVLAPLKEFIERHNIRLDITIPTS